MQPACGAASTFPTQGVLDDGSPGLEVLMIGLGGGTIAQYLRSECPNLLRVVCVEVDPRVVKTAQKFFGLNFTVSESISADENFVVVVQDAADAVHSHSPEQSRFDLVLVDCFAVHGVVPESCSNQRFVDDIGKIIKPGGLLLHHVWAKQVHDLEQRYEKVFGSSAVERHDVPITTGLNFIISANKNFTSDSAATQIRVLKAAMRRIEILQLRRRHGATLTNMQVMYEALHITYLNITNLQPPPPCSIRQIARLKQQDAIERQLDALHEIVGDEL